VCASSRQAFQHFDTEDLSWPAELPSIKQGDRPETQWILRLSRPTCVQEDEREPDLNVGEHVILKVQLVFLGHADYEKYRGLLGKQIVAEGFLFHANSGHHRTPVLLIVTRLTANFRSE